MVIPEEIRYLCNLMGRILCLDYGTKRTGIAATDPMKIIASGLTTVPTVKLLDFLTDYLNREEVDVLVVGEPKQMDGSFSDTEKEITKFIQVFTEKFPKLELVRVDERFTSKLAFQTMIDSGLKKGQRRRKALVDEISATIILQTYMDKKD